MKKELKDAIYIDDHLGCFGDFNIEDPICKSLCALSLRCAIEREENARMEILEDLVSANDMLIRIQ